MNPSSVLADPADLSASASGPVPYRAVLVGAETLSADRPRLVEALTGRLAEQTGHGVDITAVGAGRSEAEHRSRAVLAGCDLSHEDAVVVVVDPREEVAATAEDVRVLVDDLRRRTTVGAATVVVVPSAISSGRSAHDLDRLATLIGEHVDALTPVVRLEDLPGVPGAERTGRWATAMADAAAGALIDPLVRSMPDDPFEEFDRVDAVRRVGRRYIDWTDAFQDLVESARAAYGARSAALSIIDDETTRYFARSGNVAEELPRGKTVCNRVMRIYGGLIMSDARLDDRFSRLPEVRSGDVRFYAGYRITAPDGAPFGALCVFDPQVREVAEADLTTLRDLALDAQHRLAALLDA